MSRKRKRTATGWRSTRRLVVAYLKEQVDELKEREPGARVDSPDAVHRMRVACRRLRSSLATFRPLFKGSKAQLLRDELQWAGTVLGPVRDLEVMRARLHQTASTLVVDTALAAVVDQLDQELAERHSRAHQEMVATMDGPRYGALLAALEAFVSKPPWTKPAGKAGARMTLASLVRRACARVDRAAKAASGVETLQAGGPELHEVRKTAKRARYAAEVAVPSVGAPARTLVERMAELQEVLGLHQDSLMMRALIQDLADRMATHRMTKRQASALGLLAGAEQEDDEPILASYRLALAAASTDEVRSWMRR